MSNFIYARASYSSPKGFDGLGSQYETHDADRDENNSPPITTAQRIENLKRGIEMYERLGMVEQVKVRKANLAKLVGA